MAQCEINLHAILRELKQTAHLTYANNTWVSGDTDLKPVRSLQQLPSLPNIRHGDQNLTEPSSGCKEQKTTNKTPSAQGFFVPPEECWMRLNWLVP